MKIIPAAKELQTVVERWRRGRKKIGLVPTMGALHDGHLSLIREARKTCDRVIVSIYVNPIQFGPQEDLADYPRDAKRDIRLLRAEKVDCLFTPTDEEMYPAGFDTRVVVNEKYTKPLCGESRPQLFVGVATVVAKLLALTRPQRAFFGQKDYQQCLVVTRLAADLNTGCEIVMLPVVRETDGLAKSSRNVYLNEDERRAAPAIYQALKLAEGMLQVGERNPQALLEAVRKRLRSESLIQIEYVSAKNADTLEDLNILAGRVLVAIAVRLGKARLIDNSIVAVPTGSGSK
ncbi:pantoate--beta-alanine ligase [candidate division FCPU426 bacterium]|nr:pantoate--beta-alanine ligase [candidate division FCPU426 bacterium]